MTLARIAGLVYVVTFVSGTMALLVPTGRMITNLIAATSYIAVTILFYFLFKPAHKTISLLAAAVSLTGCVISVLIPMRIISWPNNPLPFFGVYCLLIGYLVYRSTYLPRFLGVLMMCGGIGWLTFAVPALAAMLTPYNFAPGIIAEGVLTLWLVVKGVDQRRWDAMSQGRIQ
ncbi:MAG TPA: DUF4386 domain-containing protein [Vicinamibacterales bacterium]|nr:DUF4386 domain-containing protein [Vicinamibacterales bacterium]